MFPCTINEIAQYIVNPQSFNASTTENYYTCNEKVNAVQALREMTTPEIEDVVRSYVKNQISFDDLKTSINVQTIDQYLAAAKIIDMIIPYSEMINTTFQVRIECLKRDKEIRQGTNKTNTNIVNVFLLPCENETDPVFLNGVNNAHPMVKDDPVKRNHMYSVVRDKIYLHPEASKKLCEILQIFYNSIVESSLKLPENTTTIFRGCSGAGKSYALMQQLQLEKISDVAKIVLSTDSIINLFTNDSNFKSTPDQTFLLGMLSRTALELAIKQHKPSLPLVQEGWYKIPAQINGLFVENRLTDIKDFDGDFRIIALRMLSRFSQSNSNSLSLDIVWRNYCECRESRSYLIEKLRPEDTYNLQYSLNDGNFIQYTTETAKNLVVKPEEMEEAIAYVINNEDVIKLGDCLRPYIGLTIAQAYTKAMGEGQ